MIPFALKGSMLLDSEPYMSHFFKEAISGSEIIEDLGKYNTPNRRKCKIAYLKMFGNILIPEGGATPQGWMGRFEYPFPRNKQGLERRMRFLV